MSTLGTNLGTFTATGFTGPRHRDAKRELLNAINRIEEADPHLNFVGRRLYERAWASTERTNWPGGPLDGMPVLVSHSKESGVWRAAGREDLDTGWFSLVPQLEARGLVVPVSCLAAELGIAPTTEHALGVVRNPYNLDHSVGGSSGGIGAGVAAGVVEGAIGMDTAGSIRIPAACNSLYGIKPSARVVTLDSRGNNLGIGDYGALARSAEMLAKLYALLTESPVTDVTEPLRPLRIGYFVDLLPDMPAHPEVAAAIESGAAKLESLGHRVERTYPAPLIEPEMAEAQKTAAAAFAHSELRRMDEELIAAGCKGIEQAMFDRFIWQLYLRGQEDAASGVFQSALIKLFEFGSSIQSWIDFNGFDMLLSPTIGQAPAKLGTLMTMENLPDGRLQLYLPYIMYTTWVNFSHRGAMSVPFGFNSNGLPLALQLIGGKGGIEVDQMLIRLAHQLGSH